jgi:hypothetical protein
LLAFLILILKVMSYEDIEKAQAKRAAKEAVKDNAAVKGKRGRKVVK